MIFAAIKNWGAGLRMQGDPSGRRLIYITPILAIAAQTLCSGRLCERGAGSNGSRFAYPPLRRPADAGFVEREPHHLRSPLF